MLNQLLLFLLASLRSRRSLALENAALRRQFEVLQRNAKRQLPRSSGSISSPSTGLGTHMYRTEAGIRSGQGKALPAKRDGFQLNFDVALYFRSTILFVSLYSPASSR